MKVAVLMGGKSFEREVSLASGKVVCEALEEAGHKVVPLDTNADLVPTLRSEQARCGVQRPARQASARTAPSKVCWSSSASRSVGLAGERLPSRWTRTPCTRRWRSTAT